MDWWRSGQCVAEEEYSLTDNMYFRNEMQQILENAGFKVEAVKSAYSDAEAAAEDDVILFMARKVT